jgi:hypothetical protein
MHKRQKHNYVSQHTHSAQAAYMRSTICTQPQHLDAASNSLSMLVLNLSNRFIVSRTSASNSAMPWKKKCNIIMCFLWRSEYRWIIYRLVSVLAYYLPLSICQSKAFSVVVSMSVCFCTFFSILKPQSARGDPRSDPRSWLLLQVMHLLDQDCFVPPKIILSSCVGVSYVFDAYATKRYAIHIQKPSE